jgi:hypothetical protein
MAMQRTQSDHIPIIHIKIMGIDIPTFRTTSCLSILKVEAVGCSKMLTPFYQNTRRGVPENSFPYIHNCKNLKYQVEGQCDGLKGPQMYSY